MLGLNTIKSKINQSEFKLVGVSRYVLIRIVFRYRWVLNLKSDFFILLLFVFTPYFSTVVLVLNCICFSKPAVSVGKISK